VGKAKRTPRRVLESWRTLIASIGKMSESELKRALEVEAAKPPDERREDIIHRLHRRFTKVRQERELQELLH
jgi:hypothetical protein